MGRASQTDLWVRRADVPMLQRKDGAARARHRSNERRRRASRSPKGEYLRGIGEPTDVPKRTTARDLRTGQVVSSGEVPVASRRPNRTGARRARRPRCTRMQRGGVRQPPCEGRNRLVKGYRLPAPAHEPQRPAFPMLAKSGLFRLRSLPLVTESLDLIESVAIIAS